MTGNGWMGLNGRRIFLRRVAGAGGKSWIIESRGGKPDRRTATLSHHGCLSRRESARCGVVVGWDAALAAREV